MALRGGNILEYQRFMQRAWAEIRLDHLIKNYALARKQTGSEICCVIKADAYGHGAPSIAKELVLAGVKYFAVALPDEAMQLRRHGITSEILILGIAPPEYIPVLCAQHISVTVNSLETAQSYAAYVTEQTPLKIHIKLDSGMHRIGFQTDTVMQEILEITKLPGLIIEGLYTHLCADDDPMEDPFTKEQIHTFRQIETALAEQGIDPALCHCANSAGIVSHPEAHGKIARAGIILYGSNPTTDPLDFLPVLSLRARVVQLISVKKGESVGYGRQWIAPQDSVIASVSIGYADGVFRMLSGRLPMLLHGRRVEQIGRICMDMLMIDVTDIEDVQVGDIVTLLGQDGDACITAHEVAALAQTIPYEIFCAIGRRVPRVYMKNDTIVDAVCYLDAM